jgi:hypothetical protein
MLSWQMTFGRGEDLGAANYDKEVSHNHIPLITNGHEVKSIRFWNAVILFKKKTIP